VALPFIGLRCRCMGVRAVFIDETLPLTALITRVFYGPNIAMTIQDFFVEIYAEQARWLKPVARLVRAIEFASWRRLPVIYTKVSHTHAFLAQQGIAREHMHTVYNPCDQTVFHPADRAKARRRWGFTEKDMVLVHHGILHPNKGNDRILRAIADLQNELPDLKYLLVGAGPEMPTLKRLAAELGIEERVVFTGWLPSEAEVNEALNAGDIGLVMRIGQWSDHFHLTDTLAHEMAVGLPILAARLEGIAEVIKDGETGYLFEPGNTGSPEEFKEKLRLLCNDPRKRNAFGQCSLQLCKAFCSVEDAAQRIAAPLLHLLEGK
jgi:glycosyltransferase involved in cell wall biosynthesis